MINDKNFHRAFLRFQFQPKLLLNRGEDGRTGIFQPVGECELLCQAASFLLPMKCETNLRNGLTSASWACASKERRCSISLVESA